MWAGNEHKLSSWLALLMVKLELGTGKEVVAGVKQVCSLWPAIENAWQPAGQTGHELKACIPGTGKDVVAGVKQAATRSSTASEQTWLPARWALIQRTARRAVGAQAAF